MPKRTTSSGPRQMDCSDGAKMLIDQMKEHPEEFRGFAGKFTTLLDTAREALQNTLRNIKMSTRDAAAILAAAEEHLYEVWLAEDVLTRMMQPKPEVEGAYTSIRAKGNFALQGSAITAGTIANTANNTSTAQYVEQVYQMERAKYEAELAKQQRRDYEYAMRNTKPFKNFT